MCLYGIAFFNIVLYNLYIHNWLFSAIIPELGTRIKRYTFVDIALSDSYNSSDIVAEIINNDISTTFDTSTVTLQEGDTFDFDGIVSTTAEDGLTAVQIDIHKADDDTVGITYIRKTNTDETSPMSGKDSDNGITYFHMFVDGAKIVDGIIR